MPHVQKRVHAYAHFVGNRYVKCTAISQSKITKLDKCVVGHV